MSETAQGALTVILCLAGFVFFLGGTVGLLRFPDLYSRLHPLTQGDTLGAIAIILALCVRSGLQPETLKLLSIILFLLLSSATCGHAIARSAFLGGILPWRRQGGACEPVAGKEISWSAGEKGDP